MIVDGIAEDGSFIALARNGEKIVFNQKPVEQIVSNPDSPLLTEATTDVTETVP